MWIQFLSMCFCQYSTCTCIKRQVICLIFIILISVSNVKCNDLVSTCWLLKIVIYYIQGSVYMCVYLSSKLFFGEKNLGLCLFFNFKRFFYVKTLYVMVHLLEKLFPHWSLWDWVKHFYENLNNAVNTVLGTLVA